MLAHPPRRRRGEERRRGGSPDQQEGLRAACSLRKERFEWEKAGLIKLASGGAKLEFLPAGTYRVLGLDYHGGWLCNLGGSRYM
jgi:hypothetical protein